MYTDSSCRLLVELSVGLREVAIRSSKGSVTVLRLGQARQSQRGVGSAVSLVSFVLPAHSIRGISNGFILPVMAGIPFGLGIIPCFISVQAYLIGRCVPYPLYAASALACHSYFFFLLLLLVHAIKYQY